MTEPTYNVQVREIVRARTKELITDAEVAIMLADLLGVDIRCSMGECPHTP